MRAWVRAVLVCGLLLPVMSSSASAPFAWKAKWIAAAWSTGRDGAEADGRRPRPIFRHEFLLKARPAKAELRIVGLGQWQASLGNANGVRSVGPAGLHGAWTNYSKEVTNETIAFLSIFNRVRNVLAVMLGNGMYNVQRTALPGVLPRGQRYTKFAASFGAPKFIAQLD